MDIGALIAAFVIVYGIGWLVSSVATTAAPPRELTPAEKKRTAEQAALEGHGYGSSGDGMGGL